MERLTVKTKIDGYSTRAAVITDNENNEKYLLSYNTLVAYLDTDGNFHKTWDGWSPTTMKHIEKFCNMKFSKKDWETLSCEKLPVRYADIVPYSLDKRKLPTLLTDNWRYSPRYSYGF